MMITSIQNKTLCSARYTKCTLAALKKASAKLQGHIPERKALLHVLEQGTKSE
jgi:hypothetical protein